MFSPPNIIIDVSFFWHEVLHKVIETSVNKIINPKYFSFFDAGKLVLGSGFDVLNSTILQRDSIPVSVFNVYDDPTELIDISESNPEITKQLLNNFNKFHWSKHPKQFDFQMTCIGGEGRERLRDGGNLCDNRTSHLFKGENVIFFLHGIVSFATTL